VTEWRKFEGTVRYRITTRSEFFVWPRQGVTGRRPTFFLEIELCPSGDRAWSRRTKIPKWLYDLLV